MASKQGLVQDGVYPLGHIWSFAPLLPQRNLSFENPLWTFPIPAMHFGYSRTALRSELHSQAPPSVDHTLSLTSSVSSLFSSSARRGSEARATTANERAEWGSRKPKGSTAKLSGPVDTVRPSLRSAGSEGLPTNAVLAGSRVNANSPSI
ncbi:hypothetical protein CC77DRAFT_306220 [Alternaria alternata]|uniref:Uncharacterized protein n=1 Tax=Alternaria alternata TaxID=5599 RepID=A0A177E2J0_ALTAL|nr:hypothetical protein CC77DRAFT_306220 [Alternaria alternata]OAG25199.1 hypothetical protein CC77DRAFT_306220 [Alternaria alternata]